MSGGRPEGTISPWDDTRDGTWIRHGGWSEGGAEGWAAQIVARDRKMFVVSVRRRDGSFLQNLVVRRYEVAIEVADLLLDGLGWVVDEDGSIPGRLARRLQIMTSAFNTVVDERNEAIRMYNLDVGRVVRALDDAYRQLASAERFVVPEVLPLAWAYLSLPGNEVGGSLHISLDDGNLDDDSLLFGLHRAREIDDHLGFRIAALLLTMTKTQRRKIYHTLGAGYRPRVPPDDGSLVVCRCPRDLICEACPVSYANDSHDRRETLGHDSVSLALAARVLGRYAEPGPDTLAVFRAYRLADVVEL